MADRQDNVIISASKPTMLSFQEAKGNSNSIQQYKNFPCLHMDHICSALANGYIVCLKIFCCGNHCEHVFETIQS